MSIGSSVATSDSQTTNGEPDPGLRRRSVRGGMATMGAQAAKVAVGLASIAVLGRLLTPADFGLVAMAVALTGFLFRFRELGLATAVIQRPEITPGQLSGLFWLSCALGLLFTLVVAAAGPALAWIYDEPRLRLVTVALSTTFLVGGVGVLPTSLLRRQLRFASLGALEVVSAIAGAGVGVVLALAGAGYWALVAIPIVGAAVTSAGGWWLCGWRPGRFDRGAPLGAFVAFGGRLSLANVSSSTVRSLDGFLVGWRFGAEPLGAYSKAMQLSLMGVDQLNLAVTRVAVPILSGLQDRPELFRGYYRRGIQLVASLSVPTTVGFFVFAEGIVRVVLGPQWDEAALLFRCLAPAALFESLRIVTSWVFVSLGQTGRQLRWAFVSAGVQIACIGAGLAWGPVGVAVGFSVGAAASWIPGVVYCFRASPVRIPDLVRVLARPVLAAGLAGVLFFLGLDALGGPLDGAPGQGPSAAWALLVRLIGFGATYVLAFVALPGGLAAARDLSTLRHELRRRDRGA